MSAHTPGPWEWRHKSMSLHQATPDDCVYAYGPAVLTPTYEYDSGVDVVIDEADMAIIAAAPDLLAALNVLLGSYVELANCGDCGSWDPEEEPMVIAARAAIAKATTP